jgi:hypothetical protein
MKNRIMGSKWTENTTTKFVELYRENECLWNTQYIIYRHKQARDAAVNRIVEEMNIDDCGAAEVKIKINNLRSTHTRINEN